MQSGGRSSRALQPVQLDDVAGYVEGDLFGRRRINGMYSVAKRIPYDVYYKKSTDQVDICHSLWYWGFHTFF